MQSRLNKRVDLRQDVDKFVFNWHEFPLDYWWRKKYNIPFGSQQHRDMNFIDMLIEYREDIVVNRYKNEYVKKQEEQDNRDLGFTEKESKVIHLSQEQIDDDYENLDLSQFDKSNEAQ